jgi:hypothetical protein
LFKHFGDAPLPMTAKTSNQAMERTSVNKATEQAATRRGSRLKDEL